MIRWFSARRAHLRRHREGIREAFAAADRLDAIRLLFKVCPVAPPAMRAAARLEQDLEGLLSRHGGRVAVRIRRERGMAIPGPTTAVVRLPRHLSQGELPARWWGFRVWLGLGEESYAPGGSRKVEEETLPEPSPGARSKPEPPVAPAGDGKIPPPPSVAELSEIAARFRRRHAQK